MKRIAAGCLLAGMLAFPALHGQDPQKDDKPPATARAKFDALVKEFAAEQQKLRPEVTKAKGDERQKLLEKYRAMGKEYAEKVFQIAEDHPKDPAAADAVFWVLQNGTGTPVHEKAEAKAKGLIDEMPVEDLVRRLGGMRIASATLQAAVFARSQKDADDPQAADLLAWVATTGTGSPVARKAVEQLIEKHPDHTAIERVARTINARTPGAETTLKKIFEKTTRPAVKAQVALSLGRLLATRTDSLGDKPAEADRVAAEAEKYLTLAHELTGKGNETLSKQIEGDLKALKTLRVGKTVPEITAEDLDGKEFKLSDYRGKVVLLDFWGHW